MTLLKVWGPMVGIEEAIVQQCVISKVFCFKIGSYIRIYIYSELS